MTKEEKGALLRSRLNKLERSEKENHGVCRKIRRELRNLEKKGQLRVQTA